MFERECFRNYQSAEENGKVVVSLLETECQKGHMREIQEDQVNRDLAEGAIFSRVSALQKPNRVPVQYRLIDDMARSGLNSLIRDSNHMLETVCLPNLRSLDRLFRLSFQLFGDDLSCCELDARAAFRHLQLLLRRPLSLYVDDLAVFSPSSAVDRDFIYLTLAIQACGVELEVAKAHLTKTPTITGFAIDLPSGTYSIPQPKQRLIVDHLKVILDSALLGRPVEVRSVESALGRLMWASQCFLHYRAYLGPIYSWVKAVRHRDLRWATLNSSSTDAIRLFLSLFSVPDNLTASFLISANKVLTLDTSVVIADASLQGLGGTVSVVSSEGGSLRRWYHASFTTGPAEIIHAIHHLVPPSGSHGEYVAGDISALELLALMLGYLAARVTNQPCPLVLMSDNSATVSAVQRVFSSVPRMASLLSAASCCRPFTNLTQAFHLPGIHNCLSDSLSRAEQVPIGWDPTAQIDLGPLLLRLSTASNVPL
ncbi:hypothetical protein FOZ62_009250 [Perkinsus olseni]|uniref:Reverse transcriptase domain-containing protein n=1 Tax=Perkinsus olseni TaxID=32597 RepID=A0A7J6SHW7_PEROL|nr:hypothetical protein FOZ62_009250 [Perkinsus olseni]